MASCDAAQASQTQMPIWEELQGTCIIPSHIQILKSSILNLLNFVQLGEDREVISLQSTTSSRGVGEREVTISSLW